MRRTVKRRDWPPKGGKTFISSFLWLPEIAENRNGQSERRWLEQVTYLAKVVYWENAITGIATRWSLEPICWIDSDEQRAEEEQTGYNFYHLAQFSAWETGTPSEQELTQLRRKVPPFLW